MLICALRPAHAEAACDCEHVIEPETLSFDGEAVAPGESVCVRAGMRESLRLSNLVGTEALPIEVRNCEGIVHIENETRGYGLTLDTSEHARITGSGDGETLGFYIRASKDGPDYSAMGVTISGYNHYIEVDHLEVVDAGFAGFILKTDPNCENRDLRDHVQRDIELHHNVIRDPGGEGFYLGNTGYPSRSIQCDGEAVDVFPHWHEGLSVHHNLVENAGWDGLQVAVTRKDCFIYQNTLLNSGVEQVEYQTRGLQLGGGASCEVFGNTLIGGTTIGIFAIGSDDTWIYNNVVANFSLDGIYVNLENSQPSEREVAILHNTVVGSGEEGIQVFGGGLALEIRNNLVLETRNDAISIGGDVVALDEGNRTEGSASELGFVDSTNGDYRLLKTSGAVDSGTALSGAYASNDADGVLRDSSPDQGAYEYTDEPRPDPGTGPGPELGGGDDSDGGCGCSSGSGAGALWLVGLVLLTLRRRRTNWDT